jgi:hypothetical protein
MASFPNVGDIARDLFRAKLCITCLNFIFFNVDGSKTIFLNKSFGYQYGILKVSTFPREESNHTF